MEKKKKINVAAILLAGGKGERMGGDFKVFKKLAGKPTFFYSLEKLAESKYIQEIIVIFPAEKLEFGQKLIAKYFPGKKISCIREDKTRTLSSYKALKYIQAKGTFRDGYIIFHDAARPLISNAMIRDVVTGAVRHGGAVVGINSPDLILEVKSGFIQETYAKTETFCGYTPQCFPFKKIFQAYARAEKVDSLDTQDSIELLLKMDADSKIKIINALFPMPKLTYLADTFSIQGLLKKYHEQ